MLGWLNARTYPNILYPLTINRSMLDEKYNLMTYLCGQQRLKHNLITVIFLNAHEPSMTTGLGVGLSSQQALFVVMWLSLNKIFTSMSLQMIKIKWIIVPYDIIKV